MRDQVRAIGRGGEIAAGKLVLALRSSFDDGEAVRNGEIDGLVVANLEMQVAVLLECAPIAAEQRILADEIQRAGDIAAIASGEDEKNIVLHDFADQAEELAIEIGAAPFSRAGIHVEVEEGVPMRLGEVAARHPFDVDAAALRLPPLFADGFALSRGEPVEKVIEACIVFIPPMKLLVGAHEKAELAGEAPFLFGEEGEMQRGGT